MSAAAQDPIAAQATRAALDDQVRRFARNWLGRELDENEHAQLAIFLAALDPASRDQASNLPMATGLRDQAGNTIDAGRQRIQNMIRQSLGRTQAAVIGNAKAERAAETAVLGAVERASSLQDLRPTKPAAGAADSREDPLIAQIAGRLTELIKIEVEACFQQQFGPLALQLQAVIEAAQASGLLPKAESDAAAELPAKPTENSGKTAAAGAHADAAEKPAATSVPASQAD
ncbi:hypothetical protein [Lysobacter sp. CA199]|uniref:hypothetical protein n=1 Tax=Lysobacter sp. CA199 TaxID=3455608 RepID=UPI003F8D8D67